MKDWAFKHPFLTFFVAMSSLYTVRSVVRAARGLPDENAEPLDAPKKALAEAAKPPEKKL